MFISSENFFLMFNNVWARTGMLLSLVCCSRLNKNLSDLFFSTLEENDYSKSCYVPLSIDFTRWTHVSLFIIQAEKVFRCIACSIRKLTFIMIIYGEYRNTVKRKIHYRHIVTNLTSLDLYAWMVLTAVDKKILISLIRK